MATHSTIIAWRIPRTEEIGGLWSISVNQDTLASSFFQSLCFLVLALSHWLEPPVAMSERTDESACPSFVSDLRRKVVTIS